MQITVNETEYCKLLVNYEANKEEIATKKTEVVAQFKNRPIKGFRNGKAPIEAVRLYYRKEIDNALAGMLAEDAVHNVVFEKNIKPIGQPSFSYINLEDTTFRCEFSMHKQPDFELTEYKEFDIPKYTNPVSVEEFSQRMLQDLRTKHGVVTQYGENDFIQAEDSVIIDYKVSHDGEPIKELCAESQMFNVGQIRIAGFSENIYGMKMGETRDFELMMSGELKPEYAGKIFKFEVKLVIGSKVEPAPLNDELAKNVGVDTFDMLMSSIQSTATSKIKDLERNYTMDQISKRLIDNHKFQIPSWLSAEEAKINAANAGHDWNLISDDDKEKIIRNSEDNIKLSLVLQKIREIEPEAQLSDEEVFQVAKENVAKFSPNPDKVFQEIYKNGHLGILFNRIKDEYTLDFIQKTCKFVE